MMQSQMTTTAFTLDGYRIVKNLGVVRGITVRSRSILELSVVLFRPYLVAIFLYSLNCVRKPGPNLSR